MRILALLVVLPGCGYPPGEIEDPWHEPMTVTVTRVVDGDTLEVDPPVPLAGGDQPRVRLLCINTPEVSGSLECWGEEAREHVTDLLQEQEVKLVFDRDSTDTYGRALAYVKHRGRLVNVDLARDGFALPIDEWFADYTWCDDVIAAVEEAWASGTGGWGECQGDPWTWEE